MKTINCPILKTTEEIITDINHFPHNIKRERRITKSKTDINSVAVLLKQNCESKTFLVPVPIPSIKATKEDMISLYEQKFRKSSYYSQLVDSTLMCPICGINHVNCLDHYYPKGIHYLFSVTPFNLIPLCSRCNFKKLETDPQTTSFHIFHAYYDAIDDSLFLTMNFSFDSQYNFVPVFSVVGNMTDEEKLYENNFKLFKLKQLYEEEATKLFYNNIPIWKLIYKEAGYNGLLNHIRNCSNVSYPSPVYGKFYKSIFNRFVDIISYLNKR